MFDDEPTQPFSRPEIDRLRRVAAARRRPESGGELAALCDARPGAASDPETEPELFIPMLWDNGQSFMHCGRRVIVSLAGLDHVGCSGAPDGMVGSADARLVFGEVGGEMFMRSPPVDEADEADELAWLRRGARRKWLIALASLVLLGITVWGLFCDPGGR